MNTHITNPRQFRLYGAVLAMAALLAVLLAVTLTAGPTMTHADEGKGQGPRLGDNAQEYRQYGVLPCTEETQPAASDAAIISDGYYAVFDGFWDYEDGHLSNNFCPPKVTEVDDFGEITYTRHDANTHISKTAFSIPDSYKVTVVDSRTGITNGNPSTVTGPTIDIADFPFLADEEAVSAVKPDPDSTAENPPNVFANNTLWWVRLDQPWTTGADNNETSPLQIGFSTDLLEEADWYLADGDDLDTDPDPPVQFEFVAFHVFKDGRVYIGEEAHEIGAHLFAFDQRATDTALEDAQWSSVDTDVNKVKMFPDQYKQLQFVFTEPGSYKVQVNFKGYVRKERNRLTGAPRDWSAISPDGTITSPVQWYTFHVGPQADVDVALTTGAVSTSGSDKTVPITVTTTNSGPDAAKNVEVEINLPPGLSAPAMLPSGATSSGCGVIAWEIGTMASGASPPPSLEFNATVDSGATGNRTITAEIHSETFDPDLTNNAASADVSLGGTNVRAPSFPGVTRSIVEHAVAGAHAGDPVAALSPDGRALSYSLSGPCSSKFLVHSNGQIVLAANQTLDYETQWEYPLVLHVSDGVNAAGEADTSADDSTPVLIRVEDSETSAVHPTVTFTLSNPDPTTQPNLDFDRLEVGQRVDVNAQVNNLPDGVTPTYTWDLPPDWSGSPAHTSFYPAGAFRAGPETYTVHIKWQGGGITASYTINWVAASS